MSTASPLLPSLRAGLSKPISYSSNASMTSSILHRPAKRKITPLMSNSSYVKERGFSTCTQCFAKATYPPSKASPTAAAPASRATPATAAPGQPMSRQQAVKHIADEQKLSLKERIALSVAATLPRSTTENYLAYRRSETLYKECKAQADYTEGEEPTGKAKFWYQDCGIQPSLGTWSQITALHMWTIMVRFRMLDSRERAVMWQQHFINHLFYDLEDLLINRHKIKQSTLRTRYLKQLNEQFRGSVAAYDEGMMRGDAAFAAALWRNIWDASPDVDFQKIALLVSYIRRIQSGLEKLPELTVLSASVYFGDPYDEKPIVEKLSAAPVEERSS